MYKSIDWTYESAICPVCRQRFEVIIISKAISDTNTLALSGNYDGFTECHFCQTIFSLNDLQTSQGDDDESNCLY
ncbi:MAG: hypothetical protein M5R37_09360 [Melioribacteraceae bacterium]|nr:hypothetical protein [Melioribacteraceae bacterium]